MFLLYVPCAAFGARVGGITGMFAGIGIANASAGVAAWLVARRVYRAAAPETAARHS
jgi:hypothetical protein